MTDAQARLLIYLLEDAKKTNCPPLQREMAAALHVSVGRIQKSLVALEREGFLKRGGQILPLRLAPREQIIAALRIHGARL